MLVAISLSPAVHAQDSFAGVWTIERTEPAPWVRSPDMVDAGEVKRLFPARIVFKAESIAAPEPLGCRRPQYSVKKYPADELFQGAFAEMGDPSMSPEKLADKVGFGKRPVTTLETGCASGIDFHLVDPDHAMFALNNTIYHMLRARAIPASPMP